MNQRGFAFNNHKAKGVGRARKSVYPLSHENHNHRHGRLIVFARPDFLRSGRRTQKPDRLYSFDFWFGLNRLRCDVKHARQNQDGDAHRRCRGVSGLARLDALCLEVALFVRGRRSGQQPGRIVGVFAVPLVRLFRGAQRFVVSGQPRLAQRGLSVFALALFNSPGASLFMRSQLSKTPLFV